jgi:hypothetical protein
MLALQKVVVMADELCLENKREATTRVPSMLEAQSNPSEKHADGNNASLVQPPAYLFFLPLEA